MLELYCKQFSAYLAQNVNNSGMDYQFVMCDLSVQLALEFHYPGNTSISIIIYVCILLITTVCLHIYPLIAYYMSYFSQWQFSNTTVTPVVIFV